MSLIKFLRKIFPKRKRVIGHVTNSVSLKKFRQYINGNISLDKFVKNKVNYTTQDVYEDGSCGPIKEC